MMQKNKYRSIELIMEPGAPHMVGDGFRMHGFFPGEVIDKKRMSPFFLMDYNALIEFSPAKEPRGVGVHPHRGFETVTIVYKGSIAHHDSAGNSGVIRDGEVQWMTAGSGILHKEFHEQEFTRNGGPFHMVQLWVNLPAKHKMTAPKYQELTATNIVKADLPGYAGHIEIQAGNYNGLIGPAHTFSDMNVYNIRLNKGGSVEIPFNKDHNTGILVIEGAASFTDGETVAADHFVLFNNDGELLKINAEANSLLLLLSGEPINEPIAQYGPFLMNTMQELEQAINDVSAGKFGKLE
jgi:redox-sensitive bicupin YhaK (pirin superfamily)